MSATRTPLAACALAVALTGCSAQMVKPIERQVNAQHATVLGELAKLRSAPAKPTPVAAEYERGIYLPVRTLAGHPQNPNAKLAITINQDFDGLQPFAQEVTQLTGIPVVLAPDVLEAEAKAQASQGARASPATGGGILPPFVPSIAGRAQFLGTGVQGQGPRESVSIDYTGPLSGLLDVAAARFGVSWQWLGQNRIRFYRYATRTFQLAALPGDLSLTNTIGNSAGGAAGSSGTAGSVGTTTTTVSASASTSSQQTGVSFSGLSVWKAVENSVKTMLSPNGKVSVAPATGTVTVTDTPQVLDEVAEFIRQENESLTRQVIVNVRVLSVDLTREDQYGIDWALVYNALSQNLGWSFSNAFTAGNLSAGAPSLTLKILSTAGAATNSQIKAWQGSQALIAAFSSQGRVSQLTSASLTTLNDQAAPFQVGHQNAYLAASSTTTAVGVGATATLQPGVVNTGFALNVMPHVLSSRQLLLQFTIDLSDLISIDTVTSGGSSIQTPNIDQRDFMQRVKLESGDTLVLTGFEQASLSASTQGPGSARNTWLGGGLQGSREHHVLVILIQPFITQG